MQRLGLTSAELELYHSALRSSHLERVRVLVTDLAGDVLATLSDKARVLDGAVTVDATGDRSTRSLSLSLLDPAHALRFDTDSPDDGAIYQDRMLRVDHEVWVGGLGRWVPCTVFHGPVEKVSRPSPEVVNVECQGKEVLASGYLWRPLTLKKGAKRTDAIRTILRDRAGEDSFSFPSYGATLPSALTLSAEQTPWQHARRVASSMDKQLFYDGRGVCVLRDAPGTVLYGFRSGDGGDVLTPLSVAYSTEDLRNTVVVTGGKPKDKKKPRPRAVAMADPTHPLAPGRLGRNGVARHLVESIQDDAIKSNAEAARRAKSVLDSRLLATVEVSFDSLRVPHLDPGDLVSVRTDAGALAFRLEKWTFPLGEGSMSVGYTKRRKPAKGAIRR